MKKSSFNFVGSFASVLLFFGITDKMYKALRKYNFIFVFLFLNTFLIGINHIANAQADFGTKTATSVNLSVFGGLPSSPSDISNDTWAFIKASKWAQNLWDKNGIPYDATGANLSDQINTTSYYPKIVLFGGNYLVGKEIDWTNFNSVIGNTTPIKFRNQGVTTNTTITSLATILNTTYTITASDTYSGTVLISTARQNANNLFVSTIANAGTDFYFSVKYKDIFQGCNTLNDKYLDFLISYEVISKIPVGTGYEFIFRRFIRRYDQTPIFQIDDELAPVPVVKVLDGLEIEGVLNSTTISYEANMHNGFYEETGKAVCPICDENSEANYQVAISDMFQINNSLNVRVANIKVNGNSPNIYFEGLHIESTSDAGTQFGHNGIKFWVSKNISVENCDFNFMGLDGINIYDPIHITDASFPGFNQNPSKYYISNCKSIFNRRQGCTVSAVDGINIEHSEFSNTGEAITALSAPPNQAQSPYTFDIELSPGNTITLPCIPNILHSKPSAGMDIEPEGDNVKNGIVTECIFKNNYRCEIVADGNGDVYNPTEPENYGINWEFKECLIEDDHHQGPGILIWQRQYLFDDCDINTGFLNGCKASILGHETKFTNCRFSDKTTSGSITDNQNLINSEQNALRLTFDNCKFNVFGAMHHAFNINPAVTSTNTPLLQENDYNIMKNCEVTYYSSSSSDDKLENLYGFRFQGNNRIVSFDNTNYKIIRLCNSIFEGSTSSCTPNNFDIDGKVLLYFHSQLDNKFTTGRVYAGSGSHDDGYFNFNIENEAQLTADRALSSDPLVSIDINKNVQFNNKFNGSIRIQNCNAILKGKLINHKNSYINFDNTHFYSTLSDNPFFYFDANAYYGIYPTPSIGFNTNYSLSTALSGNVPPCIQGGNTQANGFHCSPVIYSNISTNGAFPIMYNLVPNGAQFDFTFQPVGGVPNYTCTLDGNSISLNSTTNTATVIINPGVHALTITDGNSCSSEFYFNTDGSLAIGCQEKIPLGENPNPISNLTSSQLITINGSSTVLSKNFYIDGQFTVDQNINFQYCHFYLTPGSSIQLTANNTLNLNHCKLQAACNGMWGGIYAIDPTAEIIMDDCNLNDAIDGIVLTNNAKGTLAHNSFDNNYNNIRINLNTIAGTCNISKNTFEFNGSLLPPYDGYKPAHGIEITNSTLVDIGSNGGNTFENLSNGVSVNEFQEIIGEGPNLHLYIPPQSIVQLIDNQFKNIQPDINYANIGDEIGSGVYAHRSDAMFGLRVNVFNTIPVVSNPDESFANCEKAVWLRNTTSTVDKQKIQSCGVGVLATECDAKKIRVTDNRIVNTYWGILKSGDEMSNGFTAINNNITLPEGNEDGWISFPPIGILSTYSSKVHVGRSQVLNNTISMPFGNTGLGITISEGSKDNILNNQIHFTTPNSDQTVAIPKMLGIYSNSSDAINLIGNTVDNGSGYEYARTNNAGIYLLDNKNSLLQCNNLNYTKYGVFAVGQNGSISQYDRTAGNSLNNSDANLMLWKLTQEGTMGQIGVNSSSAIYDPNNSYLDPYDINSSMTPALYNKVFRVTDCLQFFNDEIVTSAAKLTYARSGANNTNSNICRVAVTNPSTFTQTFSCPTGGTVTPANTQYPMDLHYALRVAHNEIDYSEYLDGARRADEELVQQWLENNESARTDNAILDSFYLEQYSGIVGQLNAIDRQISLLNDSTLRSTPEEWMTAFNTARTMNNAIEGNMVFEQNAKYINDLYLNTLLRGRDTLDEEQQAEIETLAFTCPYTGGNAVYRARILHCMRHWGVHYDDLVICNGAGVYKNGVSKLQEQLNQLQNYANNDNEINPGLLNEEEVALYPNPAHDFVNISCKSARQIIVSNLTGEIRIKQLLNPDTDVNRIETNSLSVGINFYRVIKQDNTTYVGKLLIE